MRQAVLCLHVDYPLLVDLVLLIALLYTKFLKSLGKVKVEINHIQHILVGIYKTKKNNSIFVFFFWLKNSIQLNFTRPFPTFS